MNARAVTLGLLSAALLATGCASRQAMKREAVVIAASANALDNDLGRLDSALDTVHRLRRVRVEGDRLSAERAARVSEATIAAWALDHDPLARARVEVFHGVREASDAIGDHAYGAIDYKLNVEEPVPGYAIDRHSLRTLVTQLLRLARPSSFKDEAKFFIEYGVQVGTASAEGIDEVARMANEHKRPPPPPPEDLPPGDPGVGDPPPEAADPSEPDAPQPERELTP